MNVEFSASERPTLGIEMELTLVDHRTGELVSVASELLEELGRGHPDDRHPKAKNELFECTVEIITGVCETVGEARADLDTTIGELREVAGRRDLDLVSLASHPFSRWREQTFTPSDRYLELVEEMQWAARRLLIFGTHYHVGVRSPEKAIAFVNALKAYLPHLLGLSASSPFWEEEDSGLASTRIKVFESLPTAGLPPRLADWEEFRRLLATLVQARCIRSIREIWWDVRPHIDFGTVELRMCDAMPTLRETAALGALSQSLVAWLDERYDSEGLPAPTEEWIVKENKWLAARHGIEASLIVDDRGSRRPLRELVTELVAALQPTAERLGCPAELGDVLAIMDHGPGYLRQRHIIAEGGTPRDVVAAMVEELATDEPGRP